MARKRTTGGIEYEYPIEVIKKYKATSTEWKLDWLEEVNRISLAVLTKKGKAFREKIRKGLF